MVDVGRDDGAAAGDLVADELRSNMVRNGGTEGLAVPRFGEGLRSPEILAMPRRA